MNVEPNFGWQNTLVLANEHFEAIATLDVGPRVVSFKRKDGENILGLIEDHKGGSREADFRLRGGHRLWVAPETAATYYPDNGSVELEELGHNHVLLTASPELEIQKSLELKLEENGLSLVHRITALIDLPEPISAWALTILKRAGTALVPQPLPRAHPGHADTSNEADYLPDRKLSLWSYTNIQDHRITWANPVRIEQRASSTPLKLGFLHREEVVHYEAGSDRFTKTVPFEPGDSYPDGNCNLEVYTDGDILELETLSPLSRLSTGDVIKHQEFWTLSRLSQ